MRRRPANIWCASSTSRRTNWARPSDWLTEIRENIRWWKNRLRRWRKALPQIPVHFVPVTDAAGLMSKPLQGTANDLASFLGPGACFLDYDGDGKPDIFLPDNGPQGGMALYHNAGDGKFEDVTKKAGLDPYAPRYRMHRSATTTTTAQPIWL